MKRATAGASEPINRPSIRPFKHGQWQGFCRRSLAWPSPPLASRLSPLAWPLAWLAECTVGDCMSRISKGCCRPNRGRETRTNCILTHANCQCMLPHPPGYHFLPSPPFSTLRSAAASKFIALQWPSERDDGCVWAAIATLHFAPTDAECVGS